MSRPPLVLIHGFTDTPRTWDAVVPLLSDRFELHLPSVLGHRGGLPPPRSMASPIAAMTDALDAILAARGLDRVHLAGNSLGALLALVLADRGRALSVTALAPAGGWAEHYVARTIARRFELAHLLAPIGAARVDLIAARPRLRALALRDFVTKGGRVAPATAAELIRGAADCAIYRPFLQTLRSGECRVRVGHLDVPVTIAWGREDRILPPESCQHYFRQVLGEAEWVELDDVGHLVQLDAPSRTAELITRTACRSIADGSMSVEPGNGVDLARSVPPGLAGGGAPNRRAGGGLDRLQPQRVLY